MRSEAERKKVAWKAYKAGRRFARRHGDYWFNDILFNFSRGMQHSDKPKGRAFIDRVEDGVKDPTPINTSDSESKPEASEG